MTLSFLLIFSYINRPKFGRERVSDDYKSCWVFLQMLGNPAPVLPEVRQM